MHAFVLRPPLAAVARLIDLSAVTGLCLALHSDAAAATAPAADAAEAGEAFVWSAFLGPFHLLLLHFPIGFLIAAGLLEMCTLRRTGPDARFAVRFLIAVGVATGILAVLTGLMRASGGGYDTANVELHRNLGYAMLGAALVTLVVEWWSACNPDRPGLRLAFRGLLVGTLGLVAATGHFGGNLTHGSDFLTRNAPPALAKMLGIRTTTPTEPSGEPAVPERLFLDRVAPLLETHCIPCHGPDKHKADFRLDVKETAFRGGDSGLTAITPGEPMKSNLLRVVMLPRDHDDAMPPEGKQGLTAEDVMVLAHWIQAGAIFVENRPGAEPAPASAPTPTPP